MTTLTNPAGSFPLSWVTKSQRFRPFGGARKSPGTGTARWSPRNATWPCFPISLFPVMGPYTSLLSGGCGRQAPLVRGLPPGSSWFPLACSDCLFTESGKAEGRETETRAFVEELLKQSFGREEAAGGRRVEKESASGTSATLAGPPAHAVRRSLAFAGGQYSNWNSSWLSAPKRPIQPLPSSQVPATNPGHCCRRVF